MKKTKNIIIILILIIIISTITFFIGRQIGLNTDITTTNTTIEEVEVTKRNISKTLTSTGEVQTSITEKLELDTDKYFETMCVEEDDIINEGENILKYTDGTYLTAPYDLVISNYSVPETKTKSNDSNYVEVNNLDDLIISITIDEDEISSISENQEVEITLSADTSKTYTGMVSKIDSIGKYSSSGSTFSVEISFTNDGNVRLGMSVSCSIKLEELNDVLTVPINAVQISDNKRYVILVENGQTQEIEIQTGLSDDEYVEVTTGLTEGQVVQVITTTKQNTVRDTEQNSNREFNMQRDETSGDMNFSMPSGMGDREMLEGQMPSMPNN